MHDFLKKINFNSEEINIKPLNSIFPNMDKDIQIIYTNDIHILNVKIKSEKYMKCLKILFKLVPFNYNFNKLIINTKDIDIFKTLDLTTINENSEHMILKGRAWSD